MPASSVYGQIPVLRASGTGATTLSAFHAALVSVGLGHYNLVRLSSVVPPGTGVDRTGTAPVPAGGWGDRLYCVYSEQRTATPGEQAWAGIGWVRRHDGGGGFLVEHEGTSERLVTEQIRASLGDLTAGAADRFTGPEWVTSGVRCTGAPVCALVIAPFECQPWQAGRAAPR